MPKNPFKVLIKRWSAKGLLILCIICMVISCLKSLQASEEKTNRLSAFFGSFFCAQTEKMYFLLPAYIEEYQGEEAVAEKVRGLLLQEVPVYEGLLKEEENKAEAEDMTLAELMLEEGRDEENQGIEEEELDYRENALHIENSMMEEMIRENGLHNTEEKEDTQDEKKVTDRGEEEEAEKEDENISGEEEDSVAGEAGFAEEGFMAASYPAYSYDWSESWNYEMLLSNFYAVDNSTSLQEKYLDLDLLLYRDLSVDKTVEGPQILIYHTHAHEDFEDSVEGDESTTIVGAGERLALLLEEEYGFRVLHHKGVYDNVRDDAYAEALPAIEQILAENPTIEVVIDLHRDSVSGDRKLVMDLQGRPTARFMFFNGLSHTKKGGDISYLENPYIQENLALSFQAQVAANEYYPGIARKVYLKAYRYNMHLKPKYMLIELGAQNNTVEEIMNACDPLAHVLAIVLDDVV